MKIIMNVFNFFIDAVIDSYVASHHYHHRVDLWFKDYPCI